MKIRDAVKGFPLAMNAWRTCFVSFKMIIFHLNKVKDDIQSVYVYFNFCHETTFLQLGDSQPFCLHLCRAS